MRYDDVIHGECCGGYNNPRFSEHMAWFYARLDGVRYYLEIGRYSQRKGNWRAFMETFLDIFQAEPNSILTYWLV